LGDPIYGTGLRAGSPPLHLHARGVSIPMRDGKPAVVVEAPAPPHMIAAMAACGA
jgi:tRNA pseudouridine32 synthase/23S rRNA pseudouridine746 synthase